jgi:Transcriptional regulator of a riboflavin/FAD biosynthetic operon
MNPNLFDFLKKLMIVSNNGSYRGSTLELSKLFGISQQAASLNLINLEKEGFIKRVRERNGQIIYFLEPAYELIYEEFNSLNFILNRQEKLDISGKVFSGLGEGKYYISQENYKNGLKSILGFEPFLGTLNIRISKKELYKMEIIRLKGRKYIPPSRKTVVYLVRFMFTTLNLKGKKSAL